MSSPNAWKRFQGMIPDTPLLIVTVQANNGDGTSTVADDNGSSFLTRGEDFTAGTKVFIKDGKMESEAPNLPKTTFEV